MNHSIRIATTSVLAVIAAALSGCGAGLNSTTGKVAPDSPAHTLTGKVHGGQQPISGAVIQLYAVGNTGLQSAATPLIAATVTTNGSGYFTITGDWDCTSNTAAYGVNPLLYIVATGGNPGLGTGANNPAIAAMAAIGPCNSFTAASFVSLNEITTVAAVYALAPFMADYTHVGASGTNPTGLINAFQTAAMLANYSTDAVPGPALPSNGTLSAATINSLADVIAPCINSSGTDGTCAGLFSSVKPTGANPPSETIGAMLAIARSPGSNAASLYNTIPPTAPYQPTLTSAPNDWTVAINFTGGGLLGPRAIAIDAGGNAWVANSGGNSITGLSTTGTLLTGASGYGDYHLFGAPQGIAVDRAGNVWVANTAYSSVVELTVSGGAVQSNVSYTGAGMSAPIGIAVDSQNNIWVSNYTGGSVSELNSAGVAVGASPLTAGGTLVNPFGIAIDASGNIWVADHSASLVTEFAGNQTLLSGTGFADDAIFAPIGVALDSSGRAYIANSGDNSLSLFTANGAAPQSGPLLGGGLATPTAIAIDGQGIAWIANALTAGSISEVSWGGTSFLSPASGLGVLNQPAAIAVDGSGCVWSANAGDNSVSKFVGLASPMAAPLALHVGP